MFTYLVVVQVSLNAKQLMYRLLHRDPKNRLASREGANEIKQHPFFRGVNWALVRSTVKSQTLLLHLHNEFLLSVQI